MDSPRQSSSPSAAAAPAEPEAKRDKEMLHKTKVIQFLGRTTPIILQNDNGPCPLLAICNILSLKNSLNLSPDIPEVSQEKLLSLVAERLIDSNTNTDNKDTGYVENQQQNISDAIDLLPRLTTGIDVNLKFRRIDDFEFTRECAIFDLLDIPLYHGWIVDPQDSETYDAIGSKSYNTLMGELVSLEAKSITSEKRENLEDDSVDFVAATTAALGIPSPSLSSVQSFDDSRKGDKEEEDELLTVLRLSEVENRNSLEDGVLSDVNLHKSELIEKCELVKQPETTESNDAHENIKTALISENSNALSSSNKTDEKKLVAGPSNEDSRNIIDTGIDSDPSASDYLLHKSVSGNHFQDQASTTSDLDDEKDFANVSDGKDSSSSIKAADSPSGKMNHNDEPEGETNSPLVDDSEPMYEGEDCILSSETVVYENREPMYEGEVVISENGDTGCFSMDGISIKQGEIIRNFMKNSASQLTIYGLFCLQDQVKERELCVFFRNNHFNTMFKYEGELYILATDQGYIHQPDLVWEKLNEVNGDTVYMTGNFKKFKMEDHSSSNWNEQNARATTAEYLASIDSSQTQTDSDFNSDLALAIALQQQEFDQQQQQQQRDPQQRERQRDPQQQPTIGSSGLVVGPQVSRKHAGSSTSSKPESKSKEKCVVM